MLRDIEYFAKSVNVTENGISRKLGYGFLFASFNSNSGRVAVSTQYTNVMDRHRTTACIWRGLIGVGTHKRRAKQLPALREAV